MNGDAQSRSAARAVNDAKTIARLDPEGDDADSRSSTANGILLDVKDLTVSFPSRHGAVRAVDGVNFSLRRGENLGIVGESGSGKTVTALALAGLLPKNAMVSGSIGFEGTDLLCLPPSQMRLLRGSKIGFVFQEPMTSLNPVLTVGEQIAESARLHMGMSRREAFQYAIRQLDLVSMPQAARKARQYPHELSGGMRQRVMIAIALACRPALLIADEPTTALDVTIQSQILTLLDELTETFGSSCILITHDMGVAARISDLMNVMYAGQLVESGTAPAVLLEPRMPYTSALIRSIPSLPKDSDDDSPPRFSAVSGAMPTIRDLPDGCRFADRCDYARKVCGEQPPHLTLRSERHHARCFGTEEGGWIP